MRKYPAVVFFILYLLLHHWALLHAHAQAPELTIDGTLLTRNGTGLRKATIFGIRVYEGSLYLAQKSSDAAAILASPAAKAVRMHFLRDVSAEKLKDAWREGIVRNNPDGDRFSAATEQLAALMPSVSEGAVLGIDLLSDVTIVHLNERELGRVTAPGFSQALLGCWIGPHPPNGELKSGMLGLE